MYNPNQKPNNDRSAKELGFEQQQRRRNQQRNSFPITTTTTNKEVNDYVFGLQQLAERAIHNNSIKELPKPQQFYPRRN